MVAHGKLQGSKPISSHLPAQHKKHVKAWPNNARPEEKALQQDFTDADSVAISLVSLLKICAKEKDLHRGRKLHTEIAKMGLLQGNLFIGSALVSMYAKCDALDKAQEVFNDLPVRNEVTWNALIAGYARHGHGEAALDCFERMQSARFPPNAFTYACVLKACGSLRALVKGLEIHAQIMRERLIEKDIVVANALVDMYIKCGELEKAQEVFDMVPDPDKVLWTGLLAGYARHGHGEIALRCFDKMQLGGFIPDAVTLACVLQACSSIGNYVKGEEIHTQIMRQGLWNKDILVCTALVDMYAKCKAFEKAQEVFNELGIRSVVLWNALIAGHAQHDRAVDALIFFECMQLEGFCPTSVTFACALKACGTLGASEKGKELHAQIARQDLLELDTMVANALIDMYVKCGLLTNAESVFDELRVRDTASWTALIAGYAQYGHVEEALDCFERMQVGGFSPDAVAFSCVLKTCGSMGALAKGEEIHSQIVEEQMLTRSNVVANALLDMYAKCGAFEKAQEVFGSLDTRSVVSWNSAIAASVQQERYEETVHCFEQMQREGFAPDAVTFTCMLKACGNEGDAYTGQKMHAEIEARGLIEEGMVGNALATMYATCGMFIEVQELFDKLHVRDRSLWSTLMLGFAYHGKDDIVFSLFKDMTKQGIKPNVITLNVILNACCHGGLLDEGQMFFETISKSYNIIPTIDHHTCIMDLLCRAGLLEKAVVVVEKMPHAPDLLMWQTLLGACQKRGYMRLGAWAFKHATQLDESNAAVYVTMRNIVAAAEMELDTGKVEAVGANGLPHRINGNSHSLRFYSVGAKVASQRGHCSLNQGCELEVSEGRALQDGESRQRSRENSVLKVVLSNKKKNSMIACTYLENATCCLSKVCQFLVDAVPIACGGITDLLKLELRSKLPLIITARKGHFFKPIVNFETHVLSLYLFLF